MVIVVKLVCYGVVGVAVMALTGALVVLAIEVVAGIRDVPVTTGQGAEADLITAGNVALFIATVGLMTAFGVGLGALLRAQVPTVAGVLIWALAIETHHRRRQARRGAVPALHGVPAAQFRRGRHGLRGRVDIGLSRPEAFLVSLAYIAVVSVAAVYISMRRDVT